MSRKLRPRLRVEMTVDVADSGIGFTHDALAAMEKTRASFAAFWGSIVSGHGTVAVDSGGIVTATATNEQRSRVEMLAVGSVNLEMWKWRKQTAYLTLGLGLQRALRGATPSDPLGNGAPLVTLLGHYIFGSNGQAPIDETDKVIIEAKDSTVSGVLELGVGVKRDLSSRWGLCVDVRSFLSNRDITTTVSAAPSRRIPDSGSLALLLGTPPVFIQVSDFTGLQSSLSGMPISNFATFTSHGVQAHVNVTAGLFFRF